MNRPLEVVALVSLLCGVIIGGISYAFWDTQRDARLEDAIDEELREVTQEREDLRREVRRMEEERERFLLQLEQDSLAREEERRELRRRAERARAETDSLARFITVTFPETESLIAELRESHREDVAIVERERDSALEEVQVLREARRFDAGLIENLRSEVSVADERALAAERGRVAAAQAAASREQWYKWGGGSLTLLLIALALSS